MPQVTDYTALISGNTLTGKTGTPTVATFAFPSTLPAYVREVYGAEGIETFQLLSEAYKETVRTAFQMYDNASGLIFVEVSEDAEINYMVFDLFKFGLFKGQAQGVAGFAPYPADGVNVPYAADVYIDFHYATADNLYLPLHEIGHAIGLKHGFNDGDTTFAPEVNNGMFSILSTEGGTTFRGKLEVFDIQAVQFMYGTQDQGAIVAASGNSNLTGSANGEHLKGNDGHNNLFGGDGNDTIQGGSGNDHVFGKDVNAGNDGNDALFGEAGSDYIQANMGNDQVYAGAGSDRVQGGQGNDTIYGGSENDALNGNRGADKVYGEAGNDSLRGGQDNDYLSGGADNDALNGDLGADTLSGGAGIDIFVFSGSGSALAAPDQVNDFVDGTDRISIGFNPAAVLTTGVQADFQSAQNAAQTLFNGRAGDQEVAALRVGSDTYLFYASNGGGSIDSAVKIVGVEASVFSTLDFA